jgi:biopolymer transport protein ExbD
VNDLMNEGEMEETEKINVVPLADLTLVLLIILMVLSPMISQSMIRVATPHVQSAGGTGDPAENAEEKIPLLVSINEKGYALNNVPFEALDPLMASLKEKLQEDRGRPVIVSAVDGVFVGQVVEVVDGAKQLGAQEVSLIKSAVPERKK